MAVTSPNGRRCGVGPYAVASRTPSQPAAGTGAPNRRSPTGGFGERQAQEGSGRVAPHPAHLALVEADDRRLSSRSDL